VVFYCHFPDKLLANGEFVEGGELKTKNRLLKSIYRYPMDLLEEVTTRQADIILANSKFTARIFNSHFSSIRITPKVVYPGINFSAYEAPVDLSDSDIVQISSARPTLLSLNRFEKKKNAALAISSFALLRNKITGRQDLTNMRLVIAGGYDPRLQDNMMTLVSLIDCAKSCSLTYHVITPSTSRTNIPPFNSTCTDPDVIFLLNFTTSQRSALLTASSTITLLYTPTNEHFGIGPVEGMLCGLPILACNSGGPTESIVHDPPDDRTGWLCPPDPELWANALLEIVGLEAAQKKALSERASTRARNLFGMEAMAKGVEASLRAAVALGSVGGFSSGWLILLGFLVAYFIGPLVMPSS
jgi:alpha-1,3/alpha-1,6-mannosyltransferase